ncbi:MAG: glycerol-3-phosphate responsive antiterminator [Eubacteriales bacterium]
MIDLIQCFEKFPVIAAVRNNLDFEYALNSRVVVFFILNGNIFTLKQIMKASKKHNKLIFLHIDLIKGVGKDSEGVMYLAKKELCHGIVTTKSNLIEVAKSEGLITIQRLFLLDSAALKTGRHLLKQHRPDAIEILPGIAAPYFIEHLCEKLFCPVIAGGLISSKREIEELFKRKVLAVSTSKKEFW